MKIFSGGYDKVVKQWDVQIRHDGPQRSQIECNVLDLPIRQNSVISAVATDQEKIFNASGTVLQIFDFGSENTTSSRFGSRIHQIHQHKNPNILILEVRAVFSNNRFCTYSMAIGLELRCATKTTKCAYTTYGRV